MISVRGENLEFCGINLTICHSQMIYNVAKLFTARRQILTLGVTCPWQYAR